MGKRVAAVDCGTNSIRLLISEVLPDGTLKDLQRHMKIVRLGQGVDATGEFAPEALERTRLALADFIILMQESGVDAVRMVATSATRDAANKEEFFAMTAQLLGQVVPGASAEVISGDEEAALSFAGAISDLPANAANQVCVIDLGGGSTEFVVGDTAGNVDSEISTQMGCVRIRERCLLSDPATALEIANARKVIGAELAKVRNQVAIEEIGTVVGCAGTFTTFSAVLQELVAYDPQAIHGSVFTTAQMRACAQRLYTSTATERGANPVIHPGRVDVLNAGAVIVEEIMQLLESVGVREIMISEKDILDGIASNLAATLNSH
ncbi:Ppx/GppA phosphatase family protein [Corynebacterium caspium]|uniref:Ppx/GppA phosphatase family protein n=1 Tax=Corynebacterium caspium TaxID=234828 RepID=UPI000365CB0F|nr:Ppx/GppA phosphatase family protein [Corynebacterium caspium]WKD59565.1 Guanosine-5'-triphosphate,3'-diphosphate pyrophosphatase [Corynebacterium caspium DSM 44850]